MNIGPTFINSALTPFPQQSTYLTGAGPFEVHNVNFAWGPDGGPNQRIELNAWGITPSITADIGSGWQLRALANYGESTTEQHTILVNGDAMNAAISAGLVNPYNVSLSNAAALAATTNWETYGNNRQKQFNARLILDGDLATLPGGGLKIAVGAEYLHESVAARRGNAVPGGAESGSAAIVVNGTTLQAARPGLPLRTNSRNVKSVFGELVVPLFSPENRAGGLEELTLSLAGRYDSYSDFGSTFNPKIGLTWRPAEFIKFRGSWGKSFAAPSLMDNALTDPVALTYMTGSTFSFLVPCAELTRNGITCPLAAQSNGIVLLGSKAGIQPEKATTWSIGADIDPLPGLKLSATYWNISYTDVINQAPFTNFAAYFSTFRNTSFFINTNSNVNAVDPAWQALVNQAIASATTSGGTQCTPAPGCIFIIEDNRKTNLGRFHTNGVDFTASYRTATGFGGADLTINGSYVLNRDQSATASSAFVDILSGAESRFKVRTTLGADIGNLRAQLTWNHTQGYTLATPVPAAGAFPAQTQVGAYNVIDLFFRYNVPGEGALKNLAFTLGVNNLFGQDPPEFRRQDISAAVNGFINGATVGRLVQVGVSKRF